MDHELGKILEALQRIELRMAYDGELLDELAREVVAHDEPYKPPLAILVRQREQNCKECCGSGREPLWKHDWMDTKPCPVCNGTGQGKLVMKE